MPVGYAQATNRPRAKQAPLHGLLGADAPERARQPVGAQAEDLDAWERWGRSAHGRR
jgi:hypothetical protein